MTTESENMSLEKALKVIEQIAERYDRDMQACAMARRVDRERRNAIHAAATEGGASGWNETL